MAKNGTKSARPFKQAKKAARGLHPATLAAVFLAFVVGVVGGAVYCLHTFQNDHFLLRGETALSLDANGERYVYREEGVDAVCFGRDVSGKVHVETTLKKDGMGRYVIPTDKEGVYTITYTVDCLKFGEKAPNGVIKRIRVFTVSAQEEDGRDGE